MELPVIGTASPPSLQRTIQAVLPYAQAVVCDRGSELMSMGDSSECFYYVEKGSLEVYYTSRKTKIVVALIGAGSFTGEIGFFDHLSRTRNIRAAEEVRLRRFDHRTMERLRAESPVLYADFMELVLLSVCQRFRQILSDRAPLTAYAAALSTGREHFKGVQPLPADLLVAPDWRQITGELEDFKAGIFDLAYRLHKDTAPRIRPEDRAEGEKILNAFFETIRQAAPLIEQKEEAELVWGYVFKEVFPYFVRSRFFERAYYKPKGYAGDFNMIEMIYRNQPEGDGKLGHLLDGVLLDQLPARAVRGRRGLLHHTLDRLCRERLSQSGAIQIMNLACGPCRELFDLLAGSDYSDRLQALCIDIDTEALQFADREVDVFKHRADVRFMHENVIKWAIGRARQDFGLQDIIYSSGLCDYMDDRLVSALIRTCHAHLKPGGVLIIGNFSPANHDRPVMDHLLYWRLIHRDAQALRRLFGDSAFGEAEIIAEEHGINLFALARRTAP